MTSPLLLFSEAPSGGSSQAGICGIDNNTIVTTQIVDKLPTTQTLAYQPMLTGGVWQEYLIEIDYLKDYHTLQMPVASTTVATASFAVVANPTWKKVVKWRAEKVNEQPTVPAPDSSANCVLLYEGERTYDIVADADGLSPIYTIQGSYVYGIVNPASEQMIFGFPPYLTKSSEISQNVTKTDFAAGIATAKPS